VIRESRRVSYSVLASSIATEESTGNWTFTQALMDGFGGRSQVDGDHDTWITLAEVEEYSRRQMDRFEDQRTDAGRTGLFPAAFRVARARGLSGTREDQAIEVFSEGEWHRARVVERNGDQVKVQWIQIGYDLPVDQEWVSRRDTRSPRRSVSSGDR
jgi:hypothetical protein